MVIIMHAALRPLRLRYTDKRLLYLARLSELLRDSASDNIVEDPQLVLLPHMQDERWPVLQLRLGVGNWQVQPTLSLPVFSPQ